MSNILIIAEKPDVAKDIAGAMIPGFKTGKGYFHGTVGQDIWVVTSAYGHLLTLKDPEDYDKKYTSWKLEDLPIYFPDWGLKEPKEAYKKERLTLISKLLAKTDLLISAGDPDDEGQLLIDEIIDFLGYKGEVKRVLINDSMPDNIRREFARMADNASYRSLGRAANARRMADYCFGVNETRLAGIRLNQRGLAIGRVQTPTLGLVIARDMLIEQHVKTKYYEMKVKVSAKVDGKRDPQTDELAEAGATGMAEVQTDLQAAGKSEGAVGVQTDLQAAGWSEGAAEVHPGALDDGQTRLVDFSFKPDKKYLKELEQDKVTDRDLLQRIGESVQGNKVHFQTTVKDKVTNAPLPYNLTALQSDMNKRYGYSMSRTLDITQSLRSKHAITYNRSDSQYLKEEHYQEAPDLFQTILNGTLPGKYAMDFSRHSSCFNDSLVTAHHGIIPQKNNIDPDSLSEPERKVYMAIVERYAMQFLKPLVQKVSTSVIPCPFEGMDHTLEYTASKTLDPGYTAYFGRSDKDKDNAEAKTVFFPEGRHEGLAQSFDIEEKETKPPARYTDGTLAADMASIAKYVKDPEVREILKKKDEGKKGEKGSIGTVATRGVIVENLIKRGFLERSGKNIQSTRLGREFFQTLPENITKADTTARWWLIQEAIKEGTEPDVNAIQKSVIEEFLRHKDTAYEGKVIRRYEEKPKVEGMFQGTQVQINSTWGTHTFTPEELADLFDGKRISFDYYGKSVSGMLQEQTYKGRKFMGFKADEPERMEGYTYGNFRGEDIHFKSSWSGHDFTEEEIRQLLNGEVIHIKAKKKNGEDWEVDGRLARQKYRGNEFYGFKPDLKKK